MSHSIRRSRNLPWIAVMACLCVVQLSGCGPMVMLGKMLQGDPLVDDEFKKWYGKSLAKSDLQVVILCSTPESIKSEYASLDIDLLSEISRKLATHDISIVKPHKVATWIDDHGTDDLDLKELGNDLDADIIIQVKLDQFEFREENSPNLFRGRTNGVVTAFEMKREVKKSKSKTPFLGKSTEEDDKDQEKKAATSSKNNKKSGDAKDENDKSSRGPVISVKQIYARNFQNVYPVLQPVSIEQMQAETFKKKFLDHVSDDLAKLFYAHKAGSSF